MSDGSPVAGWDELIDSLRTLPERMLAKLPPAMREDRHIQQEVGRLALESIASRTIDVIGRDPDFPQFLPALSQVMNVGQPNADTIYRSAHIAPGGTYRIRGKRGSLSLAVIAQVLPPKVDGAGKRTHLDLASVQVDAQDRFDVLVSSQRPAGHSGDWWELHPAATQLMIRMVSSDWANEEDPRLSIERIDIPLGRKRRDEADLEARLRSLPAQVDFMALLLIDHVEQLRQEGYVNRMKVLELEFGALDGQFYYEGPFDLADDEALVIESPIPGVCRYRSLILTNEIYETIDWCDSHSSLNGAQAAPDPDGRLRIVVSARDPGVRNWLDTAGHRRGLIQGRWTGCDSQPIPEVRVVKLADLDAVLPPDVARVTPQERQAIVSERRRAFHERPIW
ncbi:MAG: hypothetical protein AB7F98_04985 [Novosphingobium sp.]